ncbi:LapA family protein [Kitasatospora sp. NBC_00315]|uniref:LapA family protein n=1 Tax=Kitasatospora sp. NBC_00315 TaxID=2975963 RepID=UPI0032485617
MAQNSTPPHSPSTVTVKGRAVRFRTIGLVILAIAAIWFIAANTGDVSVRLWVPTVTLPLWLVLSVTLLVGVAIGWLGARRRAKR